MKKVNGGSNVVGGYYWSPKKWSVVVVSGKEGVLQAPQDEQFIKVPFIFMVPMILTVSLMFVIFLPVIGFALTIQTIIKKLFVK